MAAKGGRGTQSEDGAVPDATRLQAYAWCREFLAGSWKLIKAEEFGIEPVSGGLSNLLYKCALPEHILSVGDEPRQVLLRVYGVILQLGGPAGSGLAGAGERHVRHPGRARAGPAALRGVPAGPAGAVHPEPAAAHRGPAGPRRVRGDRGEDVPLPRDGHALQQGAQVALWDHGKVPEADFRALLHGEGAAGKVQPAQGLQPGGGDEEPQGPSGIHPIPSGLLPQRCPGGEHPAPGGTRGLALGQADAHRLRVQQLQLQGLRHREPLLRVGLQLHPRLLALLQGLPRELPQPPAAAALHPALPVGGLGARRGHHARGAGADRGGDADGDQPVRSGLPLLLGPVVHPAGQDLHHPVRVPGLCTEPLPGLFPAQGSVFLTERGPPALPVPLLRTLCPPSAPSVPPQSPWQRWDSVFPLPTRARTAGGLEELGGWNNYGAGTVLGGLLKRLEGSL